MRLLVIVSLCITQIAGIRVTFESFEQTLGMEYLWCDLRVRKFNRTTPVLNGTLHLYQPVDNNYVYSIDMYHSRLGNQQFNHYPMRLPTRGVCDFIDSIYQFFPDHAELIENLPKEHECPVSVRQLHLRDVAFPSDLLPSVIPKGLWKAIMCSKFNGTVKVSYYAVFKVTDWN